MSDRKKPKKFSKMGYQQKELYINEELKKLGQEAVYRQDSGGRGNQSTGMFDMEASKEKLLSAASNDYDRRESLKYGVNSGDKRFAGLDASSGFNSMDALVNTDRAVAKYGINKLGHKNMSSDADYAAVSNSLFNKSRDGMSANEQQKEAKDNTSESYTPSTELADARKTVDEFDNKDYDIYKSGAGEQQRKEASQQFLGKYKLDLKKKANFKPTI